MTKQAGVRDRRHGDVMELLARARPARLDPGAAVLPPAEAAGRLAAAGHHPGGPFRHPSGNG